MLAPLLGAIRADIDRQVGWAKGEVGRQARYTALTAVFAVVAALAGVGAIVVGLVTLYRWLAMQVDPFIALAIIGGGLLLLAVILFALAFVRRRPRPALRPRLQIAQPATLFQTVRQGSQSSQIAGGKPLRLVTENVRSGSRSALLGTVALIAVVGLVIGRRLRV
jgi:MFS family permease